MVLQLNAIEKGCVVKHALIEVIVFVPFHIFYANQSFIKIIWFLFLFVYFICCSFYFQNNLLYFNQVASTFLNYFHSLSTFFLTGIKF